MSNSDFINGVRLVTQARRPDAAQPLLLEVFQTTCGPCKQQIPHLAALTQKYPGVTIISCTYDSEQQIKQLMQQFPDIAKYNCGVIAGSKVPELMQQHNVRGVPHAFIFSEAGKLVWYGHPYQCDGPLEKAAKSVVMAFTGKGRIL